MNAYSWTMEVILKLAFYILCVLVPLHMLMAHEYCRWQRELSARRHGVIVDRFDALDDASEVIGIYRGVEIHDTVTFQGVRYEFFGVAPSGKQDRLRGDELYLDPGLLYVSRDGSLMDGPPAARDQRNMRISRR
jgi:hypothetical protein